MTQFFCRSRWNLNYVADQHFLGTQNFFQRLQITPGGRQRRLLQGRVTQDREDLSTLAAFEHFLHYSIITDYRIDLRPTNADKIESVFAPYIKVAEEVSSAGKARTKTSTATKTSGSGRSVEQLKAIRDWAGKNGFDVSPRGRIKAEVIDAFDAAH